MRQPSQVILGVAEDHDLVEDSPEEVIVGHDRELEGSRRLVE
jgi:hypothetical protein